VIFLVEELLAAELLPDLLKHISQFEFEARKDVAMVFNFLLRRGQHNAAVQFVENRPEILKLLVMVRPPEFVISFRQFSKGL
jgi:calcium binding protein 39